VHNEELHNLQSLANFIKLMELKRMRLAGHVARTEWKHVHSVSMGETEGQDSYDEQVYGRLILK
jgi:hypothetical protein